MWVSVRACVRACVKGRGWPFDPLQQKTEMLSSNVSRLYWCAYKSAQEIRRIFVRVSCVSARNALRDLAG